MTPTVGVPNPTTGVVVGALGISITSGIALVFAVTEQPAYGVVSVWPTGGFIYTPDPRARLDVYRSGTTTTDRFAIRATDRDGASTTIAVSDVPVAAARAAVVATVPVSEDPEAVTLSPDDTRAYVAHSSEAVVSIIDTSTYTLIETVVVGDHPADLSFSPDGSKAYVIHGSGIAASVIDTATHSVIGSVPIGEVPPAREPSVIDDAVGIIGTATNVELVKLPRSIAVNSQGTCAFVANPDSATVSVVKIAKPPES